jgi:hypothetical protein
MIANKLTLNERINAEETYFKWEHQRRRNFWKEESLQPSTNRKNEVILCFLVLTCIASLLTFRRAFTVRTLVNDWTTWGVPEWSSFRAPDMTKRTATHRRLTALRVWDDHYRSSREKNAIVREEIKAGPDFDEVKRGNAHTQHTTETGKKPDNVQLDE